MPLQGQHIVGFDPVALLYKLNQGKSLIPYRKGTVIYAQGDPSDSVFFLQTGQVRLTVCSPRGKEAIIGLLGPGDFLGEGSLVGQATRVATATATVASTVIRVEKAAMAKMLRNEQKFSEVFLSYLLRRELSMEANLLDQMFNSTDKRLARALLLLARAGKGRRTTSVIPRVTHETLAQMIGATRAQVSTLMSEFRKKGYIHYDGDLRINESLVDVVFHESAGCAADSRPQRTSSARPASSKARDICPRGAGQSRGRTIVHRAVFVRHGQSLAQHVASIPPVISSLI